MVDRSSISSIDMKNDDYVIPVEENPNTTDHEQKAATPDRPKTDIGRLPLPDAHPLRLMALPGSVELDRMSWRFTPAPSCG